MVGIGRAGVTKIFGAMNMAPPVKEAHYEGVDKIFLPCIKKFQNESMQAAICKQFSKEETVYFCFILCYFLLDEVSGDGTWQDVVSKVFIEQQLLYHPTRGGTLTLI